jgi:GT2 family glycosyltransferase
VRDIALREYGAVRISILVATHHRRDLLRTLLDSLDDQTTPPTDFEVIVMVDGSTDGTVESLAQRQTSSPYALRFEYRDARGKPDAINRAVELARGTYCLVLDDDMTADRRLVVEHLRVQESRPGGVVGIGPMKLRLPPGADGLAHWFKRDWDARYERLRQAEPLDYKRVFGGNLSFPRDAYLDVGGWRAGAGDRGGDVELGLRLEQHGLPVAIARDGWTTQDFPDGFREIAWNAERSGRGGVAMYESHPESLPIGLGSYHETRPRERLLRELLLLTGPSAPLLAALDPLIRRLPASDAVYRTIVQAFLWRGARAALGADERWRSLRRGTAILVYEAPVEPTGFARHMDWLRRLGHPVMSLDDYVDHRAEHRIPPARSIVVTLDARDGALPDQAGAPVTAFVDTAAAPATMDGVAVGLHGGDGEPTAGEVARRRRDLEAALGRPVDHFSHPVGADPREGTRLAAELGFRSGCSNEPGLNGPATPVHGLRRIRVSTGLGIVRFAVALLTGSAPRA